MTKGPKKKPQISSKSLKKKITNLFQCRPGFDLGARGLSYLSFTVRVEIIKSFEVNRLLACFSHCPHVKKISEIISGDKVFSCAVFPSMTLFVCVGKDSTF